MGSAVRVGRIGVIVPSTNVNVEPDMYAMRPESVSIHFARTTYNLPQNVKTFEDMDIKTIEKLMVSLNEGVITAAQQLSTARVDVIAYTCTMGSFIKGPAADQEFIDNIQKASGVKAVTTSAAAVKAFQEMGVKNVAIAHPYSESGASHLKRYFEVSGIRIVGVHKPLEIPLREIATSSRETIYQSVINANNAEAEGVFISCTDYQAVPAVRDLETRIGKPVVAANQCTLWAALRMLGIKDGVDGYGTLFNDF